MIATSLSSSGEILETKIIQVKREEERVGTEPITGQYGSLYRYRPDHSIYSIHQMVHHTVQQSIEYMFGSLQDILYCMFSLYLILYVQSISAFYNVVCRLLNVVQFHLAANIQHNTNTNTNTKNTKKQKHQHNFKY